MLYLEEADQLADGITVFDHGRVVAESGPDELARHREDPQGPGTAPSAARLHRTHQSDSRKSPSSTSSPWPACGEASGVQI
ncbi:hypothetical protein DXZ75_40665 [Streptomyces sp. AcE210]|nr:hypothetical protein DXZ75_40665 [Streptomyces sp. AcE210]